MNVSKRSMYAADASGPGAVPDSRIGQVKERMDPAFETDIRGKTEHLFRYSYADRRCRKTVLDIGCGVGYGSRRLHDAGRQVCSIDVSMDALRYATQRYPGPAYIQASGACLPFTDRSFDAVTAFEVIEHIEHADKLLNEIARVLKPEGDLFISTPNPRHFWNTLRHYIRGIPYPEKIDMMNTYHVREYHHDEFIRLLKDENFSLQTQFGQTIWLGYMNHIFEQLGLCALQVYLGYFIPRYAVTIVVHATKSS